jgi:Cu/Ag efflux protein CusF
MYLIDFDDTANSRRRARRRTVTESMARGLLPRKYVGIARCHVDGEEEEKEMMKNLRFFTVMVILLAMTVAPGPARAQQPNTKAQDSGDASLEGTVKKVDPAAKTVEVSVGKSGLWDKTLELTNRTQIETEGQRATLADIAEGVKVKASYETRVGKSFATHIELVPTPEPKDVQMH